MSLFFETIKYKDGEFFLLDLHQKRLNDTRLALFGLEEEIDLKPFLIDAPKEKGLFRCRVSYGEEIEKVEYFQYQMAKHETLSLLSCGDFEYAYKSKNRDFLNMAVKVSDCDDVLFLKEGLLTDASYSNLAFFDGEQWFTPETYLLNGVKRQHLLQQRVLKTKRIRFVDLLDFKKLAFINAMRDFEMVYNMELKNGEIHLTLEK